MWIIGDSLQHEELCLCAHVVVSVACPIIGYMVCVGYEEYDV